MILVLWWVDMTVEVDGWEWDEFGVWSVILIHGAVVFASYAYKSFFFFGATVFTIYKTPIPQHVQNVVVYLSIKGGGAVEVW